MKTVKIATAMLLMLATAGAAWSGPRGHWDRGEPLPAFHDRAQVISSTPIYESFNEPRRECWTEEQAGYHEQRAPDRSYTGAVIGGIVGGLLGKQVGRGSGRTAATIAGAATGAIVGDNLDNDEPPVTVWREPRQVQRCREVDHWSRRITGYDVAYRYQGQVWRTVLPYDPGDSLRVKVTVRVAEHDGSW